MPVPLGAKSKLYFNVESTPGELATFSSSRGLRLFFNNFVVNESFDPFAPGFVCQYPDSTSYARSGYRVGARLTYPRRYFGGHSILEGSAFGSMSTIDLGDRYLHGVTAASSAFPAMSFIAQVPIGDGTWSEFQLVGSKAARFRIRHQTGSVLREDVELMGMGMTWVDSLTTVPSTGNGFSPATDTEVFVTWSDLTQLQFNYVGSSGPATLTPRGYEITIDNAASQFYTTGASQRPNAAYRGGVRRVRAVFDVEMDDAWEDFHGQLFGSSPDSDDLKFGITLTYRPAWNANWQFSIDGDWNHILARWRGIDGPGGQYARIEYQTVRGVSTPGITTAMINGTEGPTGWSPYGDII